MFSRIAHKVTKGDLKPATIENPSHILIVNATTQVGLALTEELTRGKWNRMFKVTAAAMMNEKEQKMEKLKSFESQVLQFDPLKMLAVESYLRDNEVHVLVLTGSTSLDNIQMSKDWIDTAKRAGVDYFVMLSPTATDKGFTTWGREFQELERYVSSNAPFYTIVRTSLYIDNLAWNAEEIKNESILSLPLKKQGYFAPIYTKDVAKALSFILLNGAPHHSHVYELTGLTVKNGDGLAKMLSKTLGKEIKFTEISMDEERARLKQKGFNDSKIDGILSSFESINRMEMVFASPDFARITNELQCPLAAFVEHNMDMFGGQKEE